MLKGPLALNLPVEVKNFVIKENNSIFNTAEFIFKSGRGRFAISVLVLQYFLGIDFIYTVLDLHLKKFLEQLYYIKLCTGWGNESTPIYKLY